MAKGSRVPILLALLAVAAVAVPGVFAVQLNLSSDAVARVGGTGQVQVLNPTNNALIEQVTFGLSTVPPYYINEARVQLTFAEVDTTDPTRITYTVVVNLYDSLGNIVGSGSVSGITPQLDQTTNQPISQTVTVTLSGGTGPGGTVNPKDVVYVEVLVIQEVP